MHAPLMLQARHAADRSLLFRRVLWVIGRQGCNYTARQLLSAGQHNLRDAPDGLAILNRDHRHRDFISRLERRFGPTLVTHGGGIFRLCAPVHDLSVFILYVELEDAMGIGPEPLGNSPFEGNRLLRVVSRVAMMSRQRKRKDQNTDGETQKHQEIALQGPPPHCEEKICVSGWVRADLLDAILKTALGAVKQARAGDMVWRRLIKDSGRLSIDCRDSFARQFRMCSSNGG